MFQCTSRTQCYGVSALSSKLSVTVLMNKLKQVRISDWVLL